MKTNVEAMREIIDSLKESTKKTSKDYFRELLRYSPIDDSFDYPKTIKLVWGKIEEFIEPYVKNAHTAGSINAYVFGPIADMLATIEDRKDKSLEMDDKELNTMINAAIGELSNLQQDCGMSNTDITKITNLFKEITNEIHKYSQGTIKMNESTKKGMLDNLVFQLEDYARNQLADKAQKLDDEADSLAIIWGKIINVITDMDVGDDKSKAQRVAEFMNKLDILIDLTNKSTTEYKLDAYTKDAVDVLDSGPIPEKNKLKKLTTELSNALYTLSHNVDLTEARVSQRYIPENSIEVKDDQSTCVAYLYNIGDKIYPAAMFYRGTARKPFNTFWFKTEELRDAAVKKAFEACRKLEREKEEYKKDRKELKQKYQQETASKIKIGDIVVSTIGYNMVLNRFYEIVDIISDKTVMLRAVKHHYISGDGFQGYVEPVTPIKYIGDPFRSRIIGTGFSVTTREAAYLWDGKPKWEDHMD